MTTATRAAVLLSGLLTLPGLCSERASAAPAEGASSGSGASGADRTKAAPMRPRPPKASSRRLVLRGSSDGRAGEASSEYGGVTPGLPTMPRLVLPRDAATKCYVTWIGFQILPTGSRVFLQLNRAPDKDVRTSARDVQVDLVGCRVHRWNNLRPLDLRFFDTPFASARVRYARRKGASLHVALKRPAQVQVDVRQLQGWTYLFISIRHGRTSPRPPGRRTPIRRPPPRTTPKGPSPP